VDQHQQATFDSAASAARKGKWTTPEVDKLLTAGASSSAGADTDAGDLTS
jgi:hypothetical protein